MDPVYTVFFLSHHIRKFHVFFHDFFFCRDLDLIFRLCKWNAVSMCRISRQVIDHVFPFFMVNHDLMHDLRQFSIRSRHHDRGQCRVKIISSASAVPEHVLSVHLKPILSTVFIFLVDPAKIYRILVYGIHAVHRFPSIFRFRCEKSSIPDRGCPGVQGDLIVVSFSSDHVDPTKIPLGMFLIPGENILHEIQDTVILFACDRDFLYCCPIYCFFRCFSWFRRHTPDIFLTFFHSPVVNRCSFHRTDPSCSNRDIISVLSEDFLRLRFQKEKRVCCFV